MPFLSLEKVGRLLRYEPETGFFFWRASSGRFVKAGDRAGCVNSLGYVQIQVCGQPYYAHRLAWFLMLGAMPARQIDHINGNPADNRFRNLRAATNAENGRNRKVGSNNTSGFKGASRHRNKFRAMIKHEGRNISLGTFQTAMEAHAAYQQAAERYHGEFRRLS